MTQVVSNAELVEAAKDVAELLVREGWVQNGYKDGAGRRCLTQAMMDVGISRWREPDNEVFGRYYQEFYFFIRDRINRKFGVYKDQIFWTAISQWNDTPGRTKEDVISVLVD